MAKTAKKKATPKKVEAIKHKEKRTNIPTEELRDFVAEDEQAPKTLLYPRDPSLDPQLVWKGKDEQDRSDLAVPVVPIYIQEKIHPQAIIDALPRIERESENQLNLYADFNGIEGGFEKKLDFYSHDAGSQPKWSNRMILGDSLLVMTSLAEKEGLKGKVQCIYFDPPYGIKFGSNWQVSTRKRDVKDGRAEDATRQPEQIRAFRDTWKLGIHSYLAYLRDRLVAARELLSETGSVFVQIGDENVHLVRSILDEVFGSENFQRIIVAAKTAGLASDLIPASVDFVVWYAKDSKNCKVRAVFKDKVGESGEDDVYRLKDVDGRVYRIDNLTSANNNVQSCLYAYEVNGKKYSPPSTAQWKTTKEGMKRLEWAGRLSATKGLYYKRYLEDFPVKPLNNLWADTGTGGFVEEKWYVVQTNAKIAQRCLLMTTDPGDLVLDPTCGSGTTAYAAEQWGRRWITCDTSRVALALARTRLMSAKYSYYLLADTPEGIKKESEITGKVPPDHKTEGDIKKGFVYKRVPHVTLKSIANNPDIREGMTRQQIDAAIARHSETETLFDQPYEDKDRVRVCGPFTVESLSPHRTISVEEKKRMSEGRDGVRVQVVGADDFGHMILENLRKAGVQNTHKGERLKFDTLDPYAGEWIHGQATYTEYGPQSGKDGPQMAQMGTDDANAGKGSHLRSSASSVDKNPAEGIQRRAAICIGPEHGTVGAALVKEAAKEAVKGVGFDLLIVCGFAFDPSVSEEAKRYGKLTVLPTKMNPDLAMGDELLKKTGAGNLFMVFGEPDVEIRKVSPQMSQISADNAKGKKGTPSTKEGSHLRSSASSVDKDPADLYIATIHGLDVYDPTTGAVRNSSTDDIACWFIDTDYNGESFFVRHAYFTGADEPYEKLKRALRADIDETAWSTLYSTESRPFPKPTNGKIAVKVINHYGDEVMRVFGV